MSAFLNTQKVCFCQRFERWEVGTVADVFGERVPDSRLCRLQVQCLVLGGGVRRLTSDERRLQDELWGWSKSVK